jgi:cell division septal protein FtsQ
VEALPDSSNMPDSSILEEEPHAESRRAISFPAVVLLFLVLSTAAFLNSPYFLVRAVKVAGCRYLSDYEVLLIAGVPENTNIFLVPTGQMERRLLATPRIRTARVYRILPDTISVAIEERTTALYIPYAGYFIDVDEEGHAISISEAITDLDVPLLVGAVPTWVEVGEPVRPEYQVSIGARVGAALLRQGIPNISEVDVSSCDDIVVRTTDGIRVFIGGAQEMESRVRVLDSILASIREQGTPVDYIDLRVEAKPVIRPR